jgi:hypothetical protein
VQNRNRRAFQLARSGRDGAVKVRRKRTNGGAGAASLVRLRGSAFAWVAALALILQIGLSAAHGPTKVSSAELAAAALSAAIGQQVSLCAEGAGGHSGAPDGSSPCCDDCALCSVGCHLGAAALQRVATLLAPQSVIAEVLTSPVDAPSRPPTFFSSARSRAPPLPV